MNIADISPAEVANWLRIQARKYDQMANTIESDFKVEKSHLNGGVSMRGEMAVITAEDIRKQLVHKSLRISKLAEIFNVPEKTIEKLVSNPENKITIGDRGWLKVTE